MYTNENDDWNVYVHLIDIRKTHAFFLNYLLKLVKKAKYIQYKMYIYCPKNST